MNSRHVYSIFHADHLIDLLRSGGHFPGWLTFSLPSPDSTELDIQDFLNSKFPPLSEERHEIWLKFRSVENGPSQFYSLEDIESAHFYSLHRQEATSPGVIQSLSVYKIPVGEPMNPATGMLFQEYEKIVRERAAATVVKAWFPDCKISREFIYQVKLGYLYQQSASPDKLPPIPSELIWAHMVAYNAGLRKFDERPNVLWLQDIQAVIKGTDAAFKQELKSLGEKHSSKFSDLLDSAEKNTDRPTPSSKWLSDELKRGNSYLVELDKFLSGNANQSSFFYSALLYIQWRERVLNADFAGNLADNNAISSFLKSSSQTKLVQAVAEALFTVVYAGGPRVFQRALIEARQKILSTTSAATFTKDEITSPTVDFSEKHLLLQKFADVRKGIGKTFKKMLSGYSGQKKREIAVDIKDIIPQIKKVFTGDFDYPQYEKLCHLFGIHPQDFVEQQLDDLSTQASAPEDTTDSIRPVGASEESKEDGHPGEGVGETSATKDDLLKPRAHITSKDDETIGESCSQLQLPMENLEAPDNKNAKSFKSKSGKAVKTKAAKSTKGTSKEPRSEAAPPFDFG